MPQSRIAEYPVDALFLERWSPRAFTGEPMPKAALFSLFEAARWAPSSYNAQPWRFLYALRDTEHWPVFLSLLVESNQVWAKDASALVFLLAKKSFIPPGKTESIQTGTHSFDAGAAWASLAFQAHLSGWKAHAVMGIDKARTREALQIPEDYSLEIGIVIGKQGDKNTLPEALQSREQPTPRRSIAEAVAEGGFAAHLA